MSVQLIDAAAYRRALAVRDLTDAAYGPHAMQILVQDAIRALHELWSCPVIVYRAPPLVPIADNYDDLHYPADGAARDARYTRYVTDGQLLRTQTSSMIPRALRMIAPAGYDDVLLACPGLTYRRDAIDRLHVGEPHQLELWRINRSALGRDDLVQMIECVARALLPGAQLRIDPASHPYTAGGLEVHASVQGAWVEILECGLASPRLLAEAGYDASSHNDLGVAGLAMGMGLDRMLMLRKGIDDIRVLRSNDPRIAAQMLDLQPYRAVSSQPAIQRDLSIAVATDRSAEELGDRIRATLDEKAAAGLEEISVVSETSYAQLSVGARRRLGIEPHQKNVLLRLVIRDLERTLTSREANELRDVIYDVLHEGSVKTWATRETQL
jgi:phenylalanyl-tRNA synthetase alpha chain